MKLFNHKKKQKKFIMIKDYIITELNKIYVPIDKQDIIKYSLNKKLMNGLKQKIYFDDLIIILNKLSKENIGILKNGDIQDKIGKST